MFELITPFDPARLPARDAFGWVSHPDLEEERWHQDEEHLDLKVFADAGYDVRFVTLDGDVEDSDPIYQAYLEEGSADFSAWTPSVPDGEGWWLIAIYDTEDGPCAMYIRRRPEKA